MRLAGLGALALVLVGILIYLGQSGAFDGQWQRDGGASAARFVDQDQVVLAEFDVEGGSVFAAPVVQDVPLILSGMPSYAGLEFRLPVDVRPTSGDLNLAFTSLVADDVEGVLRVSINGVKRVDYLLNEGDQTDSLQVQLTPAELASGVVSVGVSLQGRGAIAECSSDDAIAAVVNIGATSGLRLNLSGTPESVRDRLALWGDRVPVEWSSTLSTDDAASVLRSAAILHSKGYRPLFTDDGVAFESLISLAGEANRRTRYTVPASYPIALTSDPNNEGLRKFTRRTTWRYAYDAGTLPEGRLPGALDLRMQVGPTTAELERDVAITLNNRILFSRRIGSDVDRVNQSILIPAEMQSTSNALEISVSAYDADDQRCGDIAQSVAELLPETVLRAGEIGAVGDVEALRLQLTRAGSAALTAEALSAPDAMAAAYLLSALGPDTWEVSADARNASLQVISNGAAAQNTRTAQGQTVWIVYLDERQNDRIVAKRLDQAALADIPGLALLVSVVNLPQQNAASIAAQ